MKTKNKEEAVQTNPLPTLAYLQYAAGRHVGKRKAVNEDNVFALTCQLPSQIGGSTELPFGLFILADGVSGQSGGEQASATAVQVVAAQSVQRLLLPLLEEQEANADGGSVADILGAAVGEANTVIFGNGVEGNTPPATTIVVALVVGRRLYAASAGDSRLYLLGADGSLRQITNDHSMVARLVEMGQMTAAEAARSDQRSVLYRALGQAASVEADTYSAPLQDAARLLLCSDGLWGMVRDEDIAATLREYTHPIAAAEQLIKAANAAGGDDNISAVVVVLD